MSGKCISAVISSVAKYIERRRAETLGRFPVDVLFAVAIPIIVAVFPLTWWLKALLLVVLALILAELLWRIPAPRHWKLVAVVLAIMAVTAVGFQPVREQYYEDA